VPRLSGAERGVVAAGAVGARWAGRFRIFRYAIRRWRGGHIPDVTEAVDSPRRLGTHADQARRVLEAVSQDPTPVWGCDELGAGEMRRHRLISCRCGSETRLEVRVVQTPAAAMTERPIRSGTSWCPYR